MESRVLEGLINPVRLKILQLFLQQGTQTVKRIAEELPDIPQASLYRQVNKLLEFEFIEICAEYKIRGTVEKVYRLKHKGDLDSNFTIFLLGMLGDYEKYLNQNGSGREGQMDLKSVCLQLNDEEHTQLMETINEAFEKYANNMTGGDRRPRKISLVMMPNKSSVL